MTSIKLSSSNPSRTKASAVVIGVLKKGDSIRLTPSASSVGSDYGRTLTRALTALGATGDAGSVTRLPKAGSVAAPVVIAVGLGEKVPDAEGLRRAAGSAVRAAAGMESVVLALPADTVEQVSAVAEGALYAAYSYTTYRSASASKHKPPVTAITVATPLANDRDAAAALTSARTISKSLHLVRDLINTPPSDLHPADFASKAIATCRGLKLDIEVLDEKALAKGKFGGLLGVGMGSVNPPRLVRVAYRRRRAKRHLAFVGKGITFDSGGISIKPAANMDAMKSDMSGAAAVLGAMAAIARLKPEVNVTGYMAMAENMPSGSAQRPSDVITIRGGRTVEVLNTDAEGRLVLADAIVRASEDDPDTIVDVATLTGASMVALGTRTSGIMANDDDFRTHVHEVATSVGEQMWPMMLPPELRPSMDSKVADIANIGDRYGGMQVAGLFLKEFVPDGVRWAHLDIAGPAYHDGEPFGYTPKGGTGAAMRTLVELARRAADR
ncbi:MAG TPA: leucyl aminopeptidase [Actinomycetes bacterium]|nr:leucyl aminopeptidase [Actinomycetes bacterium]